MRRSHSGSRAATSSPSAKTSSRTPAAPSRSPAEDIAFTDSFERALAASETTAVEVRASIGAKILPGVAIDDAKATLSSRLTTYFAGVRAGTAIDADALLTALREETKYAIDPLKLQVSISAGDQFAIVAQGGAAFQVLPGQVFTVASVEVTALP